MIQLTIPIDPVAWQRVKRGRYGQAYVPPKTARFKAAVAKFARVEMKGRAPLEGPLEIDVCFYLIPPKRPRYRLPAVRPDLDNLVKGVKDALNGICWKDDGQVTDSICRKRYDWTAKSGSIRVYIYQKEESNDSGTI